MLLSELLASFITLFGMSLINFITTVKECQIFLCHITESSESNYKIRFQNTLISPCRSAMFWNFAQEYMGTVLLTCDVIQSHLTRV